MSKHMTRVSLVVLLLVAALYPGVAAAHGGADLEVDPCVRWVGESAVHFSSYQPQYESNTQYCTDIPKTGETQTVADWRPSHHPTGVVRGETTLEEGLYRVIITAEGQKPLRYQYLLRVQMTDYQKLVNSVVVPLLGVMVMAWLGYKLVRSKWLRNRWAGIRS